MKTNLKILMSLLCLWMIAVTVRTSLQSNLFAEWSSLAKIPWMVATLNDFYINMTVIFVWVAYKERTLASRLLWLVLLAALGSIATTAYVFLQLAKLKEGDPIEGIFLRGAETSTRPA